ncbi:MAG: hypothetical protein ACKVQV_15420 [Bacteroidia bacterium]
MKCKLIYLFLFLLPLISHSQNLFLNQGDFRISSGFFYGSYKSVFDMDGERKLAPKTTHAGMNLSLAAGFIYRWNGMINLPFIYNKVKGYNDPGGIDVEKKIMKPGDMEVGLKYLLISNEEWKSCITAWQSLGTATRDSYTFLHTGYGDYNSRMYFDLNYVKYPKWTAGTYLGFNKRNKDNSDEVHAGVSASFLLTTNLFLDVRGDLNYSLENRSKKPVNYELGLFHNNARWINTTGSIRYEMEKWFSGFVSYTAPVRGQYVFNAEIISVGFTLKLSKTIKVESTNDSTTSYTQRIKIN